ncbi:MAG: hypothetical protein NZM94_05595, partial [Roseiflexus sp.]|nr:hypothetical protein [Roseiflexus sp.]
MTLAENAKRRAVARFKPFRTRFESRAKTRKSRRNKTLQPQAIAKMKFVFRALFFLLAFASSVSAQHFSSYRAFRDSLNRIVAIQNANDRHVAITNFLDALQSANKIPFAIGDSVAFLYRGAATSVRWNGD